MDPVDLDPARAQVAAVMTEAELLTNVRSAAGQLGWLVYHTHRSDRSEPGFPDLVLVRRSRAVFVELKNAKRKPTAQQRVWLKALAGVDAVEVYLWRPVDWLSGAVVRTLR